MAESQVIHTPDSTGAGIRTISVTTIINGTPTTVQMQVMQIADENGTIISDFASYNIMLAQLAELRAIRQLLAMQSGGLDLIPESSIGVQ